MPASWSPFCGATGNSHENLPFCSHCGVQNPHVRSPISRSTPIVISDSPPAISIPNRSIGARFSSYDRDEVETMRSASLRRLKKSGREGITSKANSLKAIVITYLRKYVMDSEDDTVRVYTTKEALAKFSIYPQNRTIESLEEFIEQEIMPEYPKDNQYTRRTTDSLQLCRSWDKSNGGFPLQLPNSADKSQLIEDLFSQYLSAPGQTKEYSLALVIDRPEEPTYEDVQTPVKKEKKISVKKEPRTKIEKKSKKEQVEKQESEADTVSRKRSHSNLSTTESETSGIRTRRTYSVEDAEWEKMCENKKL